MVNNIEKDKVIVAGFKESTLTLKEVKHPSAKKEEKFYIEGLAIPFEETSSNGVLYTRQSLIETLPQWIGLPLMYNHLIEGAGYPVGKVVEMKVGNVDGKEGLVYKAEVDPQEVILCNKIKGGYLNKVSIHILPEKVSHKQGHQEAIVRRPLELSIVPVPGFAETNMAAYMEKFGDNMKTKKESQDVEEPKDNMLEEENLDEKINKVQEEIKQLSEKLETLNKKDNTSKFATKEQFNKALSLIEELIESEETPEPNTLPEDVEVTLNDVADVLQALTNRLDRIEEVLKGLSEEDDEEVIEEDEPVIEDEQPVLEDETVIDDKQMAMERIKQMTKKENVRVLLSDLF